MSAKVKKLVWLWMLRNGGNRDLRMLFSKQVAQRHFAHENAKLRFHRKSMQTQCRLAPLNQVWRLQCELTTRVQKIAACECFKCARSNLGCIRWHAGSRTWMRYED